MKANHLSAQSLGTFAATMVALAVLASCAAPRPAPAPTPQATPTPRPAPPPTPRVVTGWRDTPITPGSWSWAAAGGGSNASFAAAGAAPLLTMRCDPSARQISLIRPGTATAAVPMAVATTDGGRTINAAPLGENLVATLTPTDPLLDSIAFSRGRFALEMPGLATLYLPSSPELSRVIEDCR